MRFLVFFLALLPGVAPGIALSQPFETTLRADFTGDGIADRASIIGAGPGEDASLRLYIGQPDGTELLATEARDLVWVGSAAGGQQPELAVTGRGSLRVTSMNEAIGRDRWRQVLTIAWRRGSFLVAGYTYDWYDTLDIDNAGTCDINLLTGKGEILRGEARVKTRFRSDLRAMPVAEWIRRIPQACGF